MVLPQPFGDSPIDILIAGPGETARWIVTINDMRIEKILWIPEIIG